MHYLSFYMHCQVSGQLGNGRITARKAVCEKNPRVDTASVFDHLK